MQVKVADANIDHCRIGSLEINERDLFFYGEDHCRIGSLEIHDRNCFLTLTDHCRIGSLEK